MKYACLISALALALCASDCDAEEGQKKTPPAKAKAAAATESKPEEKLKHIDTEDVSGRDSRAGDQAVGDAWESYDQNTGLPNVVQSDKDYELQ